MGLSPIWHSYECTLNLLRLEDKASQFSGPAGMFGDNPQPFDIQRGIKELDVSGGSEAASSYISQAPVPL